MDVAVKSKKNGDKANKKTKKIADDFKSTSLASRSYVIDEYIKFKYHIFGIKFYKYWHQTHPDFDFLSFTNFLKLEALEIHKRVFDGFKGISSKKSKTKIKSIESSKPLNNTYDK